MSSSYKSSSPINQERPRRNSKAYTTKCKFPPTHHKPHLILTLSTALPPPTLAVITASPQRYYTNRKPSNSLSSTTSSTHLHPTTSATSTSSYDSLRPYPSRSEVRRLSGNFNAPTHTEIERERKTRRSRDGMKGIDRWGKMDAVGMEVRLWGKKVRGVFSF
jgi:hypothetical protein